MSGEEFDALLVLEAGRPCCGGLQAVGNAGKGRGHVPVGELRAVLVEESLDGARAILPLRNIRTLTPVRRPHGPLGRRRVQIGLVAVSPDIQLAAPESLAGQGHGIQQGLPAARPVPAEAQVEAVGKLDLLPGVVGLKVRRSDGDGRGVVVGPRGVEGALEGVRQRGVVEGVVLGVAANTNVRLGAGEASDVVQEGVGKGVGV